MRKRTFIMTAMLFFVTAGTSAQENMLEKENNSMRHNDCLYKLQMPHIQSGERGIGKVWQYKIPTSPEKEYIQTFHVEGDSSVCNEHHTLYFYRMKGDSLLLTGFENRTTKLAYEMPQLQLRFPYSYGDSISGYYRGKGIYSERVRFDVIGRNYIVADGFGGLTDGTDTLWQVLRIHRHSEFIQNVGLVPDSLSATDLTEDCIKKMLEDSLVAKYHEDSYIWYHYGSRYPVMETIENRLFGASQEKTRFLTSFLYLPPVQQTDLGADAENEARRIRTRKMSEQHNEMKEKKKREGCPLQWECRISDDRHSIRLDYTLTDDGAVAFTVYDVTGRLLGEVLHTTRCAGRYSERISLYARPVGSVILLHIHTEGEEWIEKITFD